MINNIPQTETKSCCASGESCGQCMKGGFPLKKEILSFITLFLVGAVTVLSVLLINEKRENALIFNTEEIDDKQDVAMVYDMPALKTISDVVKLPDPKLKGTMSVEEAIQSRRSRRLYSDKPVTLAELSQVLWSAQGITNEKGYRAAPSAKSAYPYSLYVVIRNAQGIENGLYLYDPTTNTLGNLGLANAEALLIEAGVQDNSQKAPVVIVMTAAMAKMQAVFPGADPHKNIYLEGGHIGQNVYLEVESLGMATVVSGGFNPIAVAKALRIDPVTEEVVYLIPFGHIGEEAQTAE